MKSAAFFGELSLHYRDGLSWELHNPGAGWGFHTLEGIELSPPDGFVTDFASIPRALWRILPPTGNGANSAYGPAAVIHDWLYQSGQIWGEPIDRGWADDVFLESMKCLEVSKTIRWSMYLAVRAGGWLTWNRYRNGSG